MWFDNLKAMKAMSKMTTKEISAKSGIPEPTLEKLFAGVTKDPKLDTMRSVVQVLGYTLDELIGGINPSAHDKSVNSPTVLTPDEQHLLTSYRGLNQQGKEYILQTLDMAEKVYIKAADSSNVEKQIG